MKYYTILFALSIFTLTSCNEQEITGDYDVIMVGENDYSEHDITLTIKMGKENLVSGRSACNKYSGTFEILENSKVKIGPLMSTKMYCVDVAQVENDYIKHLSMVTQVIPTKKGLELLNDKGLIIITAVKK